jgi:hypothetical protein
MAFVNTSNRQRALQNADALNQKQATIGVSTHLSPGSLTAFGAVKATQLQYRTGADANNAFVDVETAITGLQEKLNSTVAVFTDSASSTDYTLNQLFDTVVSNKGKFATFVDKLNGAVGDVDSGVVSLMEQVSANKGDIAANASAISTLQSDMTTAQSDITTAVSDAAAYTDGEISTEATARALVQTNLDTHIGNYDTFKADTEAELSARLQDVQQLAGARFVEQVLSAEGGWDMYQDASSIPTFVCDGVPIEPYMGIPIVSDRELIGMQWIARQPSGNSMSAMSSTFTFLVRGADDSVVSQVDKTFSGAKDAPAVSITLLAGQQLEIAYKARTGQPNKDTRYRLALQYRLTDQDSVGA